MIKEAIQYLVNLGRNEMVEHEGKNYSTRALNRVDKTPDVEPLTLRSLSGMVDYIKSNFDRDGRFMVHVESPTLVSVFDALNNDNDRRVYVRSQAMLPRIAFDRFQESEGFNIMLQSCFVQTDQRDAVLKIVGSIVEDEAVTTIDNGITQRVAAKSGITTIESAEVPNPVRLKPFRTFVEVTQPESEFILRIRKGPEAALFEADGAAWELSAMASIADYLKEKLQTEIEIGKVYIVD